MRGGLAAVTRTKCFYLAVAAFGVAVSVAGVLVPVGEVRWAESGPAIHIDSDVTEIDAAGPNWPFRSAEVRWHYPEPVIRVAQPSYTSGPWPRGEWLATSAFLMLPALAVMAAFPRRRISALPMFLSAVSLFIAFSASKAAVSGTVFAGMVFHYGPLFTEWETAALAPAGAFLTGAGSLLWLTEPREWQDEQLRAARISAFGEQ